MDQEVQKFLDVATFHADSAGRIRCPFKNCILKNLHEVESDLFRYRIFEKYTYWVHHGESFESENEVVVMEILRVKLHT